MTAAATCAVPGCGRSLHRGNRTGLCGGHVHRAPYCGCGTCTGSTVRRRFRPATPEEIRARNDETVARARARRAAGLSRKAEVPD